ncbi:MAG: hypothetical protein HY060_09250 [Proteobacteria bacterium]|nr:hypothetical protein [Pseudomonadota bacterium]
MSAADLISPTPPARCALAVAMPLDQRTFLADLDAGVAMDFSRSMLGGREPQQAWQEDGAPLAALCHKLLEAARHYGAAVVPAATLDDLGPLFHRYEVVTIVAHWHGGVLAGGDFKQNPTAWLRRIRAGTDPLCAELARRLEPAQTDDALAARPDQRPGRLAELVNATVIRADRPLPGVYDDTALPIVIDDPTLRSRQRARLDAAFPEFLHPGNRLELRDGLHAAAAIAACVPPGWSGIVDLAICQSAFLAQHVKAGRTERRIIDNLREVIPSMRLRILEALYERLAVDGNYGRELVALFKAVSDLARTPKKPSRTPYRFWQTLTE